MYRNLVFLLFSCLFVQDNEVSILWNADLELQWSDFKAEPQPEYNAAALTASGITFGFSTTKSATELIDFGYTIEAHFYPNKSWHINRPLSDIILDHERLHFDITELHARKFRQRVANTTFTLNINVEMERIHNAINQELDDMQKRYDAETNHSQSTERQVEWQKFIASELEKLSQF